jgi:hypothetical protein
MAKRLEDWFSESKTANDAFNCNLASELLLTGTGWRSA